MKWFIVFYIVEFDEWFYMVFFRLFEGFDFLLNFKDVVCWYEWMVCEIDDKVGDV